MKSALAAARLPFTTTFGRASVPVDSGALGVACEGAVSGLKNTLSGLPHVVAVAVQRDDHLCRWSLIWMWTDLTEIDVVTLPVPRLKALAEPLRWRIVTALAGEELCVCHLTADLGAPQPLISHHLRVLREAGIVEAERWRYWTYYRLRPGALGALAELFARLAVGCPGPAEQRRPCC